MERQAVSSSNIAAIGYDENSATLEVEFNNGAVYQYFDVPAQVFNEFVASDSVGAYLAKHIKGHFRSSRV